VEEAVKTLIIGGPRHGEWIDVMAGVRGWVDIRTATTHIVRGIKWAINDLNTGEVTEVYDLRLAVHPDLVGPTEPQTVPQLLSMLAMSAFAREHGEPVELAVPDTAAELFGPDGKPVTKGANTGE
jgi:hypothetical protein